MPGWLESFLKGPFVAAGNAVWEWLMNITMGTMVQTPENFSPDTWIYVTDTLYPWVLTIGVSMVNVFFILSFFKAVSNIKENITLELCVEAMMKLVVLNVLMVKGMDIFSTIFSMSSAMVNQISQTTSFTPFTGEADLGAGIFGWSVGPLYFLVAAVCGVMILITVYSRYIKLYAMMVFYPLAMPTLIGGHGIDGTAYAWIRQFLSVAFEIVAIALVMAISGSIISHIQPAFDGNGWFSNIFDGFAQMFATCVYMILMTTAVKGAANLMNKTFNLH